MFIYFLCFRIGSGKQVASVIVDDGKDQDDEDDTFVVEDPNAIQNDVDLVSSHRTGCLPLSCKVKSAFGPSGPSGWRLTPVSVVLSDLEYFNSPLDRMPVHRRVTPSIKFAGTHLYTWVERGTVRVKCLAQEHNTMSPASS